MKNKFINLFLISNIFLTNIYAYDINNSKLRISGSDMEQKKIDIKLDLGLGDNLLSNLEEKRDKEFDKLFNPIIEDLEEIKQKNMKRLNTDNMNLSSDGVSQKWMDFLQWDKIKKSVDKFKNKYKDKNGESIFNAKQYYLSSSSLNPFGNFREKLLENQENVKNKINNFDVFSKKTRSEIAKLNQKIDEYKGVDTFGLIYDNILSDKTKGKINSNTYMKDLLEGKDPGNVLLDFYRNQYPEYYPSKSKTTFKVFKAPFATNNLCDITKCLYSDECKDENGNDIKEEFQEKIKELRKKLIQQITYLAIKELMSEMYVMEYVRFAQKATSCSVQATIAASSNQLGLSKYIDVGQSTTEVLDISTGGTSGAKGKTTGTTSEAISTNNRKVADCLKIDDVHSKQEDNTDLKVAGNEQQVDLEEVTEGIAPLSIWIPFLAVGGDGKVNTSSATSEVADKETVKSCISEGQTATWKESFNSCMDASTDNDINFKFKINTSIKNLFKSVRKHKKIQCQMDKENAKKTNYNFSLLKYSNMLPSFINTTYNKYETYSENSEDLITAIKILIENSIKTNIDSTNSDTICLDSLYDSIKEGYEYKGCELNGELKTVSNLTDFNNLMNDYCQNISEEVIKNKDDETKLKENVDINIGINYCSKYYSKKSLKLENNFNIKNDNGSKLNVALELEYRQKDENGFKIDSEKYQKLFDETYKKMEMLSETELINICINNPMEEKEDGLKSPVYYYCKSFKSKMYDKILNEAINDFDNMTFDTESTNLRILEIEKKKKEIKNKFNID